MTTDYVISISMIIKNSGESVRAGSGGKTPENGRKVEVVIG